MRPAIGAPDRNSLGSLQDNVVALTSQNTKLDAGVQEAKAAQRRSEQEHRQLQQVVPVKATQLQYLRADCPEPYTPKMCQPWSIGFRALE